MRIEKGSWDVSRERLSMPLTRGVSEKQTRIKCHIETD